MRQRNVFLMLFLSLPGWINASQSISIDTTTYSAAYLQVTSSYTVVSTTYPISVTATVTGSTVGVISANPLTIVSTGIPVTGTFWQTTQPVSSASPLVVTGSTVGVVIVNSTTSVIAGHLVSSTSLSVALPQGATNAAYIDSIGRLLTTGLPYKVIIDTYNLNASTGTGEVVLISSPAAPTRTFLCGCVFTSTGAINGNDIVVYSPTSSVNTTIAHPVNMASGTQYILWPGCSQPFMWGGTGAQITYKPSGTISTIKFHCQYYQSP